VTARGKAIRPTAPASLPGSRQRCAQPAGRCWRVTAINAGNRRHRRPAQYRAGDGAHRGVQQPQSRPGAFAAVLRYDVEQDGLFRRDAAQPYSSSLGWHPWSSTVTRLSMNCTPPRRRADFDGRWPPRQGFARSPQTAHRSGAAVWRALGVNFRPAPGTLSEAGLGRDLAPERSGNCEDYALRPRENLSTDAPRRAGWTAIGVRCGMRLWRC
jgi:hypothetical protein